MSRTPHESNYVIIYLNYLYVIVFKNNVIINDIEIFIDVIALLLPFAI
jgi:hypothetical protein